MSRVSYYFISQPLTCLQHRVIHCPVPAHWGLSTHPVFGGVATAFTGMTAAVQSAEGEQKNKVSSNLGLAVVSVTNMWCVCSLAVPLSVPAAEEHKRVEYESLISAIADRIKCAGPG